MKRTEITRKTPMKRGAPMTRGTLRTTSKPAKKRIRTKAPKMTPIRKSAKGESCTLRFPCCNFDTSTTVWAHSNHYADGKGMGIKARDEEGCYACSACHAWLDGGYAGHMPRSLVDVYFDLARAQSQEILKRKGLL